MVDPETVDRRLRQIGVQLSTLRDLRNGGREAFEGDLVLRLACERALQVAIQAAVGVANHILAEDTDVTPEDYGAAFLALGRLGVIEAELAARLRSAAGLRNVLVHLYLDVDPDRVWEATAQIDDLAAFAAAVQRYVDQSDAGGSPTVR